MTAVFAVALSALALAVARQIKLSIFNPAYIFIIFAVIFSTPRLLTLQMFNFSSEILGSFTQSDINTGLTTYLLSIVVFFALFSIIGAPICLQRSPRSTASPYKVSYAYRGGKLQKFGFFLLYVSSIIVMFVSFRSSTVSIVDTEDFLTGTRNLGIPAKIFSGLGLCYILTLSLEARQATTKQMYFFLVVLMYLASLLMLYRASQLLWVIVFVYIFYEILSARAVHARKPSRNRITRARKAMRGNVGRYVLVVAVVAVFVAYKFLRTGISYGYIDLGSLNARALNTEEILETLRYFIVYKGAEFSIFDSSIALQSRPPSIDLQNHIFHSLYGAVFGFVPNFLLDYDYHPLGKTIKTLVVGGNSPGGIPVFGYTSLWLSNSPAMYIITVLVISAPLWYFYRSAVLGKRRGLFYPYFLLSFINFLRIGDLSVAYTQTMFLLFLPSLILYFSLTRYPICATEQPE